MLREPLKDRAVGQWRGILSALGVPDKALRNRHGPCPMCGGKDRFRFDDKGGRGTWFCSHCGAGDGIEFVKRHQGVEFRDAARLIEQHIGTVPVIRADGSKAQDNAQKRAELAEMWKRSRAIGPDDLAGRYLFDRVGPDRVSIDPSVRSWTSAMRTQRRGQAGTLSCWRRSTPATRPSRMANAPLFIGPTSIRTRARPMCRHLARC